MKKYLMILISVLFLSFGLCSCDTTYAGVDSNQEALLDNIDINLIVRNGTPYYYNGYLNYYNYRGLYYYPIYYNNYWYFRAYHRPFRRGYFPIYRNWRPREHWRGYQGFGRPDRYGRVYRPNSNYRNYNRRPNVRPNNSNRAFGNGHNSIFPRSSTRTTVTRPNIGNGSIGTRRPSGTFGRSSGSSFGGSRNVGGSIPSGGRFGGRR